ncbi:unnamed protein product [Clonostachys byssicola]|uniref:Rhodopsin domain-containing protein n=1 Tax=Clonostachys byssicola TaxID=160290 RepID=A0A9N9UFI7_9HYPO|nr:unnamed protein product [Clonostachys byssicola]
MAIEFPTYNGVEVASLPPPGYEVDFDNRKQQKWLEHILIFCFMAPIALMALLQRFYTKIFLSKGLQIDDFFMLLGWLTAILTQVLMLTSISKRLFCSHSFEMPLADYESYALYSYVTAPIYMMCNGFTKLSLLLFYLQISPQTWFRRAVWVSIAVVSLSSLIIVCFMYFGCSPPQKAFRLKTEGHCVNAGIFYIATAVSNIVTDVILFVLPIPMVYALRMPRIQKFGAMMVFGIGSITIGTSVVRLALLPVVLKSPDPSWDGCPADVWTFVEANLFIICGSMPTLRKFFKHLMPRLMGSSGQSSGYRNPASPGPSNTLQSGGNVISRLRHKRKSYAQFASDGEENELQDFRGGDTTKKQRSVTVTTADQSQVPGDNHSDEGAILQTKSFTLQYN